MFSQKWQAVSVPMKLRLPSVGQCVLAQQFINSTAHLLFPLRCFLLPQFNSVCLASHLTGSRTQPPPLLSINRQLALTHVPKINTRQVQNTGALLPRQPKQQPSAKVRPFSYCVITNSNMLRYFVTQEFLFVVSVQ